MLIRAIDFESSGEPEPEEIVEVGWCDVVPEQTAPLGGRGSRLVNPGRPISPGARGVHHLSDADVAGGVSRKEALLDMMTVGGVPDVICAHEARFEQKLWTTSKRPWLCTRKAALRIWPGAPDHKLQTLRYYLNVPGGVFDRQAHRAEPDAYVGALLLLKCLEYETVEQLIEWTETPSLLPVCHLKKYKGHPWENVPDDYLYWMLKQDDMDEDLRFTARHHLEARKPKRAY